MASRKTKFKVLEQIYPPIIQTQPEKSWRDLQEEDVRSRIFNIKPLTENQAKFIKSVLTNVLTIATGSAGVGRTYLSCAMAAKLFSEGKVAKIVLSRPIVACGGEDIGFLPGDSFLKVLPYMQILIDYLDVFLGEKAVEKLIKDKKIVISPIGEMRGSSFVDSVCLIDECQNLNMTQLKMLLTRIGNNCIMILNGDPEQSDLTSGRTDFINVIKKLQPLSGEIGFINFTKEDVVRSGLVRKIVDLLY